MNSVSKGYGTVIEHFDLLWTATWMIVDAFSGPVAAIHRYMWVGVHQLRWCKQHKASVQHFFGSQGQAGKIQTKSENCSCLTHGRVEKTKIMASRGHTPELQLRAFEDHQRSKGASETLEIQRLENYTDALLAIIATLLVVPLVGDQTVACLPVRLMNHYCK